MKKTIVIALLGILLHSCKKKHVCWCHTENIGFGEVEIYDTKRKAKKRCDDAELYGTFTYSNVTYTDVKCDLTTN